MPEGQGEVLGQPKLSLSLDKIQCTVDDIDWNETELITDFEDLSVGDVVGL